MGGSHLFRQTLAMLMPETGAGLRVIQEMVGRVKLYLLGNNSAAHLKCGRRRALVRVAEDEAALLDILTVEAGAEEQGRNAMIGSMEPVRITEAELARDLHAVLARVQQCVESLSSRTIGPWP